MTLVAVLSAVASTLVVLGLLYLWQWWRDRRADERRNVGWLVGHASEPMLVVWRDGPSVFVQGVCVDVASPYAGDLLIDAAASWQRCVHADDAP